MGKGERIHPPLSADAVARARTAIDAWRSLIGDLDLLDEADALIARHRATRRQGLDPIWIDEAARVRQKREALHAVALEALRGRAKDVREGRPRIAELLDEQRAATMIEDAVDIIERILETAPSAARSALAAHDKLVLGDIVRLAAEIRQALRKTPSRTLPDAASLARAIRFAARTPPAPHPHRRGGRLQTAAAILSPFIPLSAKQIERIVSGRRKSRHG